MADKDGFEHNETPVTVFAKYGKFFVWNADDAFKIRSKYRLVGSLIGSLPRKPKQNHCFSLPFMLTLDEAMLLYDKGLGRVVETPTDFALPSKEEVDRFKQMRGESFVKQIELFQKGREEKQRELAEVIEAGRRRKRKRKRDTNEENDSSAKTARIEEDKAGSGEVVKAIEEEEICDQESSASCFDGENVGDIKTSDSFSLMDSKGCEEEKAGSGEVVKALEEEDIKTSESLSLMDRKECINKIVINTQKIESNEGGKCGHNTLECRDCPRELSGKVGSTAVEDSDIGEQKCYIEQGTMIHIPTMMPQRLQSCQPMKWTHLRTEEEKLRHKVFVDLWEKGYYITSGAKFGGDFLAYPGDPLRYHSFFIVIIIPKGRRITPFEMISAGRLGATVKKTALLCSVSEDNDDTIVYTSVKWSGIS